MKSTRSVRGSVGALVGTLAMVAVLVVLVPAAPASAYSDVAGSFTGLSCSTDSKTGAWGYSDPPANAISATFTIIGGGGAGGDGNGNRQGGAGGRGGTIVGTVAVAANQRIWAKVGCGGTDLDSFTDFTTYRADGFTKGGPAEDVRGGGGGGSTGICLGTATAACGGGTVLAVAAGGGGGGRSGVACNDGHHGGAGGTPTATAVSVASGTGYTGGNGTNGIGTPQASGGTGGNGNGNGGGAGGGNGGAATAGSTGTSPPSVTPGNAGQGGQGANGSQDVTGGGGGGGFGGGGGGGGGINTNVICIGGNWASAAGGGAGSSWVRNTVTGVTAGAVAGTAACGTGAGLGTNPGSGANTNTGARGCHGNVTITWKIGNPPTGSNQTTAQTTIGTPLVIALANADADGNARTCSVVTGPPNGSVVLSGGAPSTNCTATYTAGNNASVTDSFTYRVTDSDGMQSITYTVTIPIKRSTTTGMVCTSPFPWNGSSTCTITVTDSPTQVLTPTGSITMGATGDDVTPSFSTCTLAQLSPGVGRCTSTFTADLQDTYSITATFPGTTNQFTSGASTTASMRSRLTSTAVACSPNVVAVDTPTTCTATVTDVMSGPTMAPAGSVTFGQSGGGTFDFPTCELEAISADASACAADFTPTSAGNKTVNASYAGSTSGAAAGGFTHASSAAVPVPVVATGAGTPTRHSTSSTASCTPNPVPAGSPTTCTVTVTDTFAFGPTATPVGTVTWGYSGGGAFSPSNTCALFELTPGVSASCSVTFTPTAPAGNRTVNATYGGTPSFFGSGTGSVLVVATAPVTPQPSPRRDTTTSLSCNSTTQVGVGAGCLVTVTDVNPSPGPRSEPTGTVTFGFSGGGSLDPVTCTLVSNGDGQSSSCGTSYTPTSVGNKTVIASFTGTALHKPSGSGSVFIVATP